MTIEHFDAQTVAYMRRTGAYGPENRQLMESIKEWASRKGLLKDGIIYGIACDDPDTPPQECRYDACVVVEDTGVLDSEVSSVMLPGGQYAVFTVRHLAYAIEGFWNTLYDTLESEGLVPDMERPIMEKYTEELVLDGKCQFCVPVL